MKQVKGGVSAWLPVFSGTDDGLWFIPRSNTYVNWNRCDVLVGRGNERQLKSQVNDLSNGPGDQKLK